MIQLWAYKRASGKVEQISECETVTVVRCVKLSMMFLRVALLVACAALTAALPRNLAKRQAFPPGFPFHDNDDDTDFFNPFFPIQGNDGNRNDDPFLSFGGLFQLFEAQLRRMQEELDDLNKRIDAAGVESSSNTTVIDGHVVTVNETTRRGNDTDNPFFHHVKVVVIRPSESPEEDDVYSPVPSNEDAPEPYDPTRGDEPTYSYNDEENEIPQSAASHEDWKMWSPNGQTDKDIVSNHINSEERLSDDVDVNERLNKLAKGRGYLPVHPEVEVLRNEDGEHVDLFPNQEKQVPVIYDVKG